MSTLSGFLYNVVDPEQRLTALLSETHRWATVQGAIGNTRWERVVFHSPEFISGDQRITEAPYDYPITVRQSTTGSLLLLAESKKVVEVFFEKYCRRLFKPALKKIFVKVGDLVTHVVADPNHYVLTAANVRISAYGEALKSISFYGDDLANATMFRENLHLMNPFSCGLRKVNGVSEVIRISSDGAVTAVFVDDTAQEIVLALNYIYEAGFINRGRSL